jgi:hypothetical protein
MKRQVLIAATLASVLGLAVPQAFAGGMPEELLGNYAYPSDKDACSFENYSLTITASTIEANEFGCEVGKVTSAGPGQYTIALKCSSEDGEENRTSTFKLTNGALNFDKVDYVRCDGPAAAKAAPVAKAESNQAVPNLCRDDDQVGGPKKIYSDANLKKVSKDLNSSGSVFMPEKALDVDGKKVYQGSVASSRTGHDVPGTFFIDAKEWGAVCK